MPFLSEAQRARMHANKPEMAKEWESATPEGKLPEHVKKTKKVVREGKLVSKSLTHKSKSLSYKNK
jgi:hypothetical protein